MRDGHARLGRLPEDAKASAPSPGGSAKGPEQLDRATATGDRQHPPVSSLPSDSLGATEAEMPSRPERATAGGPGVHANKQKMRAHNNLMRRK